MAESLCGLDDGDQAVIARDISWTNLIKVVVLVLTVWNADNGTKLYESERDFIAFAITGNPIEDCRKAGVESAYLLINQYRQTYPNATSNVDCHWEIRLGEPA